MEIVVICVTVLLLATAALYGFVYWVDAKLETGFDDTHERGEDLVGASVVIHTSDGSSVRGIVAADYADEYVLRDATYMPNTPARGAVHIPKPVPSLQVFADGGER